MATNRHNCTATKTGAKPSRGKLPFFQSNKKSQAKSLLGLSHFIEVLHESTNY